MSGLVIGRVKFTPNGEVSDWTAVSGPLLLSRLMGEQTKLWILSTDARGAEPCQALVVAEFLLGDAPQTTPFLPPPSAGP